MSADCVRTKLETHSFEFALFLWRPSLISLMHEHRSSFWFTDKVYFLLYFITSHPVHRLDG